MNPEHIIHNYSKIWFSTAQETSRKGPLYGEWDHTGPIARTATFYIGCDWKSTDSKLFDAIDILLEGFEWNNLKANSTRFQLIVFEEINEII